MLDQGSSRLEWGCQTVIPAVETLIYAAKLGGSARCRISLPPDYHNPFVDRTVPCILEIQSEPRQHFVGAPQDQVKLFDPPMSEQV